MKESRILRNPWAQVIAALLCAAGMALYQQRVVIPYQIADAAAHDRPRGGLSDLYPRWLGARELLLHGRDPYSAEITREIQTGYYGRPLDSSRPNDPKDEQRFAYPVYVAFVLAPTIGLPFDVVQKWSYWVLLFLTVAAVPLWLRLLKWASPPWTQLSLILFTIGSSAGMQALKLRQLSLLVAAMVFAAIALLASDRQIPAGFLLALATIKPQLVLLLVFWLALWTVADWRRRYRFAASFLITMLVLVVAAEVWRPHWIAGFWDAMRQYQRYTGAGSVIEKMISPIVGKFIAVLAIAAASTIAWKQRRQQADSEMFMRVLCTVMAVTVLVIPTFAPYNQILLLPACLLLVRDWPNIARSGIAGKMLKGLAIIAIAWPWLTSIVLVAFSFVMPAESVQRYWSLPFWTVWSIPLMVSALTLLVAHQGSFLHSTRGVPA
jgi:hypothetical protein